jgi:hypothetical protein
MEGQQPPMEADMMNGVLDVNSSPGKRPAKSKEADRPNRQRHFSRPVGPIQFSPMNAMASFQVSTWTVEHLGLDAGHHHDRIRIRALDGRSGHSQRGESRFPCP